MSELNKRPNMPGQASAPQHIRFGGRPGGGPMAMAREIEKPKDMKSILGRLLNYFNSELPILFGLFACVLVTSLTTLAAPSLQGQAIDLIMKGNFDGLLMVLLLMLILYFINTMIMLVQSLLSVRLSQNVVKKLRFDLFSKIDHLSISYLDTHSSGDIMSRMTNDVENISQTISHSISSLFSGILTIVGTVAVMFFYCWQLTLITMVTVVITVVVTKFLSSAMRKIYKKRSIVQGQLNGHTEEMITGYKSIVAYNRKDIAIDEFNKLSEELARVSIRAEILGGSMG
ncbi:MAG: ABC transporter ATP-binding protein, partial [Lachnospiraceae bacterium]|nr:ABC transporter ATP-binding protein [Lachnospiraceae bacterium]